MRPAPASAREARWRAGEPLLRFCGVVRHVADGQRRIALLDSVTFELRAGCSAGLFGSPGTGKSTLLRLACGLELPEHGAVMLHGRDLACLSARERAKLRAGNVALITEGAWQPGPGETVLDRVVLSLGSSGVSVRQARRAALSALDRTGVAAHAEEPAHSLASAERARVELAAALARQPSLLLVDEPLPAPNVLARERFCALLREVASERKITLLVASEDLGALQGLEILMSIYDGELCSSAVQQQSIVPLASRRRLRGA